MKKLYLIILCVFTFAWINAEEYENAFTEYPKVSKIYRSDYGQIPIVSVIADRPATMVVFEYITPRGLEGGWISMASSTELTYKYQGKAYSHRIIDWGIIDGDMQSRSLDTQFNVKADKRYRLFMVFEGIPPSVTKISINENGRKGFYWEGIRLNERYDRYNEWQDDGMAKRKTPSEPKSKPSPRSKSESKSKSEPKPKAEPKPKTTPEKKSTPTPRKREPQEDVTISPENGGWI